MCFLACHWPWFLTLWGHKLTICSHYCSKMTPAGPLYARSFWSYDKKTLWLLSGSDLWPFGLQTLISFSLDRTKVWWAFNLNWYFFRLILLPNRQRNQNIKSLTWKQCCSLLFLLTPPLPVPADASLPDWFSAVSRYADDAVKSVNKVMFRSEDGRNRR